MTAVTEILDLRGNPCPENWSKIILTLEGLETNDILEVILDDIVALDRIPQAIKDEPDYKIIETQMIGKNIHLFIKVF